jgi:hypothetical protein
MSYICHDDFVIEMTNMTRTAEVRFREALEVSRIARKQSEAYSAHYPVGTLLLSPEAMNGADHNLHLFSTFMPTIRLHIAVFIGRSKHRNLLSMLRLGGAVLPRFCTPFLCRCFFTRITTPIYLIGC